MDIEMGNILVYLALSLTLGAFIVHIGAAWKGSKQVYHIGLLLNLVALLMTILIWALLTHYFRTANLDIEYVHDHMSRDLPDIYKFTGVWAGKVGSFLLWLVGMQAGLISAQAIFSRTLSRPGQGPKGRRSRKEAEALLRTTSVVGSFMVLLFLGIFHLIEPFRPTAPVALIEAPDGRGLNILLQHPLMAAHPFLALIGYGIATVPFVASVSFMLTGNKHWASYSLPFARAFFLLFTMALALGGLWAYNTFGWGGYWAWDPVETSSLLPWLMACVVCHTQVAYVKSSQSKFLGAMASYFLLPVILFATFAARSGLWSSVHGYAATPGGFWEVISASGFLSGLLFLTMALIIFGPVLLIKAYLSYFDHYEGQETQDKGPTNPLASRRKAMLFANVLILMGLLVTIFIMLLRLGGSLTAGEFEAKLAPLALVLASGQMLYHYGTRSSKMVPFAALAIAVGAGLVSLGLNPDIPIASFSIPFLGVAAAGVVYHIILVPKAPWSSRSSSSSWSTRTRPRTTSTWRSR